MIKDALPYIRVGIDLHWGVSVRKHFFSKTRETYLVPPPTTLIGALSYGYSRYVNKPEEMAQEASTGKTDFYSSAELVRRKVISVNVRVNTPFIGFSDVVKIWWFREREKAAKTDAVAVGKSYKGLKNDLNTPDLDVVYFLNKETANKDELKQLVVSSYSIIRLGGSHGLASVRRVSWGEAKPLDIKKGETAFSFWADLSKTPIPTNVLRQLVIDPAKTPAGDYSKAKYREQIYPLRIDTLKLEPVEVEVVDRARLYEVEGELVVVEH